MAKKYVITETQQLDNRTRVFTVLPAGRQPHEAIDVWWDGRHGNCTNCSGPLSAMSASCKHVSAVKRHLGVKPEPKAVIAYPPETPAELRRRAKRMREHAADVLARAEQYEHDAAALERGAYGGANEIAATPV